MADHPVHVLSQSVDPSRRVALVSPHLPPSFSLRLAFHQLSSSTSAPNARVLVIGPQRGRTWSRMVDENDGWIAKESGQGRIAAVMDRIDFHFCPTSSALLLLLMTLTCRQPESRKGPRSPDAQAVPEEDPLMRPLAVQPACIIVQDVFSLLPRYPSGVPTLSSLTNLLSLILSLQSHVSSLSSSPIPLYLLDPTDAQEEWPLGTQTAKGPQGIARKGRVGDVVRYFFPIMWDIRRAQGFSALESPAAPFHPATSRFVLYLPPSQTRTSVSQNDPAPLRGRQDRAKVAYEVEAEVDSEEARVAGLTVRWTRVVSDPDAPGMVLDDDADPADTEAILGDDEHNVTTGRAEAPTRTGRGQAEAMAEGMEDEIREAETAAAALERRDLSPDPQLSVGVGVGDRPVEAEVAST